MAWKGWEGYVPPEGTKDPAGDRQRARGEAPVAEDPTGDPVARRPAPRVIGDRGTRRGARRVVVTEDRQVVDHGLAKGSGVKGVFFQSRREALRWVALLGAQDREEIQNLRRQVKFALQCRNAAGLVETVTNYTADFTYNEREQTPSGPTWRPVVEDVKPRGGLREDAYILKKRWFEAQYGLSIRETH